MITTFTLRIIARAAASAGLVLAAGPVATAQFTGRFAVSMSFAPGANEVTSGTYSAADIVVFHSTATGSGGVQWSAANLGLVGVMNPNIDAFSDGTDVVVPPSIATCTDVIVDYSVTGSSVGTAGSLIESEKAGNGAKSDVFSKVYVGGVEVFEYLANDHQNIAPSSQIDALAWGERTMYPAFFSVDPTTATALSAVLGFSVSPADILSVVSAGAAPIIFKGYSALGLNPNDDIDALGVDFYKYGVVVISLTATSPSLGAGSTYAAKSVGSAGLIAYEAGSSTPIVYKKPEDLDLLASDELTAVRLSDPCLGSFQTPIGATPIAGIVDGNEPSPSTPFPWNYETIKVDNYIGNAPRQVWIKSLSPTHTLTVRTQFPNQTCVVFVSLGKVCTSSSLYLPLAKGVLGVTPLLTLDPITPGQPGLTLSLPPGTLPIGLEINLQGVVFDPLFTNVFTTNVVTMVTVP